MTVDTSAEAAAAGRVARRVSASSPAPLTPPHRSPATRHSAATGAGAGRPLHQRSGPPGSGVPMGGSPMGRGDVPSATGRAVPAGGPPVRSAPVARTAPMPRDLALGAAELRGILRVVEDCERASSLASFRELALDGMARHLGYRHSAFFLGSSLETAFQDARPTGRGLALRLAGPYLERYRELEALSNPDSLRSVRERGLATLDDLGVPERPEVRMRLERFLRAHGIHAKLLIRLFGPSNVGAVVSLLDSRPGAFGPRDRAVGAVLGRHLGNLLRFYIRADPGPSVAGKLSARERDVVRLVAEGRSNRQVAEALCISIDTVKHHLTHALVATGCTNRTQLAIAWQRETSAFAAPGNPRP
ncbi:MULTISPECIES: helix-turn-helix transcriptional regulator [Frankia]|nr:MULTISPECIES: LuxR C-terminal-related transcriptional regulator [Frankia]